MVVFPASSYANDDDVAPPGPDDEAPATRCVPGAYAYVVAVSPDAEYRIARHGACCVLDHGVWRYTTVIARVTGPQDPRPTDAESLEIAWVPLDDVPARPLLVAFGAAWPTLRRRLDRSATEEDDA